MVWYEKGNVLDSIFCGLRRHLLLVSLFIAGRMFRKKDLEGNAGMTSADGRLMEYRILNRINRARHD